MSLSAFGIDGDAITLPPTASTSDLRCFYYNAVTAVSQWERPTTPAAFFATNDGEQTTQLGPSYHDNHHSDAEGSIKDGYIAPCDGNDETAKAGTHAVILPID